MPQSQVTMGHAYHLLHKTDEAAEAIQKANALFQQIGDDGGMTLCQQAMWHFMGGTMPTQGVYAQRGQDMQQGQQEAFKPDDSGSPAPAGKVAKLDAESIV